MSISTHARPAIPGKEELARLPSDGGPKWNRLVFESSPYLLQHAANPVDWYPWGDEAFETARRADKPVFLSIGYSTCHWCHVMEHECFEDEEIGRLMNEAFVCIKVDREERPDIDHVYMTVTQAMTGSGGWPMTVLMTPDKKPFFAGTYFPRESRYGRPGMKDLVPHISRLWQEERERLTQSADYIAGELGKMTGSFPGDALDVRSLEVAFGMLRDRFDGVRGGFGNRPKFPVPHNLSFLLRHHARTGNEDALQMASLTLEKMRLGGIFDQIGYGFHRYSTDEKWLVPHFEKMLYDQALMAICCLEGWQVTGDPLLRQTAEEVFEYVLRDMTSPEGGFYSAEDADSEGEEGKFYVWSREEVLDVLGEEEGRIFCEIYRFQEGGNFEEESTGRETGANIPHLSSRIEDEAKKRGLSAEELTIRLVSARERLFVEREKRIHPLKDDKILTDWNGLMIAALAKAARAFDEPHYRQAAERAAGFVLNHLRTDEGRLLKRYREGSAGLPAHLEDYAFAAWGLTELYEATFDVQYLRESIDLSRIMIEQFHDEDAGGFFQTASDGEPLLVRSKDIHDGAIPSGNAVAALVLARLGRMTGNDELTRVAEGVTRAFSRLVAQAPANHTFLMMALDFLLGPTSEIVLSGDGVDGLAREVNRRFLPRAVLLHRPVSEDAEILSISEFLRKQAPVDGKATAYVCRDYACRQPVQSGGELAPMLDEIEKG